MPIHRGTVLAGLSPNPDPSINSVYRGDVLLDDGSIRRGFVKDLDPRQLGNELLVAELGDRLRVSVPECAIVRVPRTVSAEFRQIRARGGDDYIAFCSIDAEGSTVAQIVAGGALVGATLGYIKRPPTLGKLYGFDTWLANVDRHEGNLIIRGDGQVFLIDHGYCLSGPSWSAADLEASKAYVNRLRYWLTPCLSREDKDHALADIRSLTSQMMAQDVQAVIDDCFASSLFGANDTDAAVGFLEGRVQHVLPLSANSLETL